VGKQYRRNARAALDVTRPLTLEQRGAFATIMEWIMSEGTGPEDHDLFIAGAILRRDPRVWRRFRQPLIEHGLLRATDGRIELGDAAVAILEIPGRRPLPQKLRLDVWKRSGGRCVYCRVALTVETFTVDHIDPVSRGGGDSVDNLAVACRSCNCHKSARTPAEWTSGHG